MTIVAGVLAALVVLLVLRPRQPTARRPSPASTAQPLRDVKTAATPTRRWIVVGVTATGGVLLLGPVMAIAVVAISMLTRRWRRFVTTKRESRARVEAMPELIESLVVLIDAGCSPAHAIHAVARRPPPALAHALDQIVARLGVGVRLTDALDVLTAHVGESARLLVDTITRAEIYGDPLGPLLVRLHDEATRQRRQRADIAARQLPIRLCFPLVCCTLPSFAILTIVPLLAGAFSSLRQSPL
jgi:pilus assembly protein TadC